MVSYLFRIVWQPMRVRNQARPRGIQPISAWLWVVFHLPSQHCPDSQGMARRRRLDLTAGENQPVLRGRVFCRVRPCSDHRTRLQGSRARPRHQHADDPAGGGAADQWRNGPSHQVCAENVCLPVCWRSARIPDVAHGREGPNGSRTGRVGRPEQDGSQGQGGRSKMGQNHARPS